jgi:hypothetical protein
MTDSGSQDSNVSKENKTQHLVPFTHGFLECLRQCQLLSNLVPLGPMLALLKDVALACNRNAASWIAGFSNCSVIIYSAVSEARAIPRSHVQPAIALRLKELMLVKT